MKIETPAQLYRFILRSFKSLPKDTKEFYSHQAKQSFRSHSDETNPERIKQIIERAIEDTKWIVDKYKKS
ncbi:hypothetical protein LOTGIDRAFT_224087 [Lottia gigantea]|uniref:LYR motif-containing protein 9 n=1 Tax=Lottia gigantea TaxID=225164 RepID=V4AJ73_LOTGI|nr:hypothetical protein LOTGIDRAFT_224087 [Lottia gigantea]ESP04219.1 hypothetical protein LOTGIDRAFT_224087 [Lottia gigantea]